MKRRVVRVVRSRIEDVEVGDVVNRDPDLEKGWFEVALISVLFNGQLQISDETELMSIAANNKDIVGVQFSEVLDVDPETGLLLTPEPAPPVMMAAPAPGQSPPAQPTQALVEQPAPAPEPMAPQNRRASDPQPEESDGELPSIVAEATPSPSTPPIDLRMVADLLANLDVEEEAPTHIYMAEEEPAEEKPKGVLMRQIRSARSNGSSPSSKQTEPAASASEFPDGAVAVDGGPLPDKPSYKNPVVVADAGDAPLMKRRR